LYFGKAFQPFQVRKIGKQDPAPQTGINDGRGYANGFKTDFFQEVLIC
jgi:hypothetical protein